MPVAPATQLALVTSSNMIVYDHLGMLPARLSSMLQRRRVFVLVASLLFFSPFFPFPPLLLLLQSQGEDHGVGDDVAARIFSFGPRRLYSAEKQNKRRREEEGKNGSVQSSLEYFSCPLPLLFSSLRKRMHTHTHTHRIFSPAMFLEQCNQR